MAALATNQLVTGPGRRRAERVRGRPPSGRVDGGTQATQCRTCQHFRPFSLFALREADRRSSRLAMVLRAFTTPMPSLENALCNQRSHRSQVLLSAAGRREKPSWHPPSRSAIHVIYWPRGRPDTTCLTRHASATLPLRHARRCHVGP